MGEVTKNSGPFFVGLDRLMLSLGPLSDGRHCPYDCAFCYVGHGFSSYQSLSLADILEWVKSVHSSYSIIYVSGDTDSFAPPRTQMGLELLEALSELEVDLLFTTRMAFEPEHLKLLSKVAARQRRTGHLFIGCISIPRLRSGGHLESPNTPTPSERIETLRTLHELGLQTVLTVRPFLPVIPVAEYVELVEKCLATTDVVLGESWYADEGGILERRVFQGSAPEEVSFSRVKMDFDGNEQWWRVWSGSDIEKAIGNACADSTVPFFMRSLPAVEYLRARTGCATYRKSAASARDYGKGHHDQASEARQSVGFESQNLPRPGGNSEGNIAD